MASGTASLSESAQPRAALLNRLYWAYFVLACLATAAALTAGSLTLAGSPLLASALALPTVISAGVGLLLLLLAGISAARRHPRWAAWLMVAWALTALAAGAWLWPDQGLLWVMLALGPGILAAIFLPWYAPVPATLSGLGLIWLIDYLTNKGAISTSPQWLVFASSVAGLSLLAASAAALIGRSQHRIVASAATIGDVRQQNIELTTRNAELAREREQERDRLSAVLENSFDGIVLADADSIISTSSTVARQLLNDPEPLEERSLSEWTTEQPGKIRLLSHQAEGERQHSMFTSSHSTQQVVALRQAPIRNSASETIGYVGIFHNQTNAVAVEQMRTELLDMLARDMLDPLTSVQSAHDALLASDLDSNNERVISTARRTTARLLDLVHTLQELSKIQHNPDILHRLPHPLRPLVESTVAQITPLAQQRSINVVVEYGSDGGPVLFDADRMRRVMLGLLDNALKYSPAYSTIRVQTNQASGTAQVRIIDQGPVIDAGQAATLFERFGRAPDEQRGGSLGLAFSKQVIEAHGGRLWVESSPGKGSSFTFSLPA